MLAGTMDDMLDKVHEQVLHQDMRAYLEKHGIEGVLFVMVQNPDKGKAMGQLMVSVELALPKEDSAAGAILLGAKGCVEGFIPQIFGNATKVERNA